MAARFSLNAKLYRNTGSYGSPVWSLINNVKDLTMTIDKRASDVTTRGANGWGLFAAVLKDASIEFSMLDKVAPDSDLNAIRDAFLNDTQIEFAIMDDLIVTSGAQGLRATCEVFTFSRNEKIADTVSYDIKIQPADSANAPSWLSI